MNKTKKAIRRLFIRTFSRKFFQPFFKKLHWVSLRGMNYGGGHSPHDSGEIYLLNYIKKRTNSKTINILDVGANLGQYALLANNIFKTNCIIYSFEPTELAFKKLKKNTISFGNIKPINKGVGDFNGETQIFYDGEASVQSSIVKDDVLKYSETIELVTIDDFCKTNNIQKITILKLDVEGYEYQSLMGASSSINNIDYIQFEFGNKQVSSRHFLSDFITLLDSFKIYRLIQNGLIEIDSNPINEIFQTSNYVAINKKILGFNTD